MLDDQRDSLPRIKESLGYENIRVIAYIRAPLAWANSYAQQLCKKRARYTSLLTDRFFQNTKTIRPFFESFGRANTTIKILNNHLKDDALPKILYTWQRQ